MAVAVALGSTVAVAVAVGWLAPGVGVQGFSQKQRGVDARGILPGDLPGDAVTIAGSKTSPAATRPTAIKF